MKGETSIEARHRSVILVALALICSAADALRAEELPRWGLFETAVINSNTFDNPFADVTLNATFTRPNGSTVSLIGFHDGDGRGGQNGDVWKLRLMPDELGHWTYIFTWTDGTQGGGGAFDVVDAGLAGPFIADPQNSRVWRVTGRREFIPFYLTFPGYLDVDDPRMPDFLDYADQALGANGVAVTLRNRVWLDCEGNTDCTPSNPVFSIANWKRLDDLLTMLAAREMGADIMFYTDDAGRPRFGGQSEMEQMLFRYTMARLAAYPAIVFDSGIDILEYRSREWNDWFAQTLIDLDPWDHVVGSRHGGGSGDFECNNCTHDSRGDVHPGYSTILSAMMSTTEPVFYTDRWREDHRRGNFDSDSVRHIMWHCAVSGGAGFMIGGRDGALRFEDFEDDLDNPPQFAAYSQFWHEQVTDWNLFTVCNDDVSNGFCFGESGREYVIYMQNGGTTIVDLSGAEGTFPVKWLNPRSGQLQTDVPVDGGDSVEFEAPDSNDWVLHIGGLPPDDTPPTAPSDLQATTSGEAQIDLRWTAADDPETGIIAYRVYRDDELAAVVPGDETVHHDTGLPESSEFDYQVSAVNGGGLEGPRSEVVSAKTLPDRTPPTILLVQAISDRHRVMVTFSETVDRASAQQADHYGIEPGIEVWTAVLQSDEQSVVLTTSAVVREVQYTLTVNGVKDRSRGGNVIERDSRALFVFVTRVTEGVVAVYDFEEGQGTTVHDVSGVDPPLDLTLADEGNAEWIPGALSIISSTIVESAGPGTKIISAARQSDEMTIEAWIKPDNTSQGGPARMVTLSQSPSTRNFTVGQSGSKYSVRFRTAETDHQGRPSLHTPSGTVTTELTHVVYTYGVDGLRTIYLGGKERISDAGIRGDLSNWDNTHPFALANEITRDRAWLGEFHLVAIYGQALDQDQVAQNFMAGVDDDGGGQLGDLDGDGDVDLDDYRAFHDCMTGPGGGVPNGCDQADLDGDGDADLMDMRIWTLLFAIHDS